MKLLNIIKEAEKITQHYNEVKNRLQENVQYVNIEDRTATKVKNGLERVIRWFWNGIFFFFLFLLFLMFITGENTEEFRHMFRSMFTLIIVIAVFVFVKRKIRKKLKEIRYASENERGRRQVDQQNKQIDAQNAVIKAEILSVNDDMEKVREKANEHLSWGYPRKYCYSDAVCYFIDCIENYRADNLKEAINLYVDELRYRESMAMQKQVLSQIQTNNVLTAMNLYTNMQTKDAVKENTKEIRKTRTQIFEAIQRNTEAVQAAGNQVTAALNSIKRKL